MCSVNSVLYIATNQSLVSVPVASVSNATSVTTIATLPDMHAVHVVPSTAGSPPQLLYAANETMYSTSDLGS